MLVAVSLCLISICQVSGLYLIAKALAPGQTTRMVIEESDTMMTQPTDYGGLV